MFSKVPVDLTLGTFWQQIVTAESQIRLGGLIFFSPLHAVYSTVPCSQLHLTMAVNPVVNYLL